MRKYDYNRTRFYGYPLQVRFLEKKQEVEHTGIVKEKKPDCLVFQDGKTVFRSRIISHRAA
ncbi:hypothetical protein [Pontibacter sp. SGAir0037]|uniref:hypothetical protein n=1 Tax=Pontibacter sp. SGAir0037 TaxID=2571030 RepID=UPI0010CCB1E7|nr:hypothetical protein [Pontibacter sp. SGAir0037]QCR23092.1 hypothetical protein C1N53_12540 [Pontibacter sp. SGAir0037]